MRTHVASNIPCALVRPPSSISGVQLRALPDPCSGAKKDSRADDYQVEPRITYVDRAIIRDYFHQHRLDESVGPAWKKALFPEPHRQLPWELECRLSVPFPGQERVLVGSDVLLVETATREIMDVMHIARPMSGPEGFAARERNCALMS